MRCLRVRGWGLLPLTASHFGGRRHWRQPLNRAALGPDRAPASSELVLALL